MNRLGPTFKWLIWMFPVWFSSVFSRFANNPGYHSHLAIQPILLVLALLVSLTVTAQQSEQVSEQVSTTLSESETRVSEDWNLTVEEVETLEDLKRRNRGMISPEITPLEWLGIFADSEAERRRYAELFARRQLEIVDAVMRFETAYAEAIQREISKTPTQPVQDKRLLLITPYECLDENCRLNLSRALRHAEIGNQLDIYIQENIPRADLRFWVMTNNIPIELIRSRSIRVQSAKGRFRTAPPGLFSLE